MKPADVQEFTCGTKACGKSFTGTLQELAQANWFLARGSSPRYASCPAHLPEWVPAWREKKAREKARREEWRETAEHIDQANGVWALSTRWELAAQWPTAWDEGSAVFKLAESKAYELGGGTVGGSIMTGAPLYNSPSKLSAIFPSEESALAFVAWLKAYFEPRKHENCDVRFWELDLKRVDSYSLL